MPTGYTSEVQDGKIKEFPDFAMRCARAFGALIDMRDAPADAEIPDALEPSPFYQKKVNRTKADLEALDRATDEQIVAWAGEDNNCRKAYYEETLQRDALHEARYRSMLDQARSWTPPTPEHQALKDFMIQQLEDSIKHDCGHTLDAPKPHTPTEWLNQRRAVLKSSLEYNLKNRDEEQTRTASRSAWVQALRASLAR